MEITGLEIVLALAITFVAAFAQGVVGMGMAVVSVPALLLINPALAPVPQLLMAVVLSGAMALRERQDADLTGVTWILVGRLPGALVGLALLAVASAATLDVMVATVVLSGVLIRASGAAIEATTSSKFLVGVFSGTSSMVSSIGGPPVALLYQDEKGPTIRSSLNLVFVVGILVTITGRTLTHQLDMEDVRVAALLTPAMLAGLAVSVPATTRIDEKWVRYGIMALSSVAGVGLLIRVAF